MRIESLEAIDEVRCALRKQSYNEGADIITHCRLRSQNKLRNYPRDETVVSGVH